MRWWWSAVLIGLLVGFFGCGDGDEGSLGAQWAPPATVTADGGKTDGVALDGGVGGDGGAEDGGGESEAGTAVDGAATETGATATEGGAREGGGGDGPAGPATPRRPFGSHQLPYKAGILPSGTAAELDGAVRAVYDRWKGRYLASGCGGVYVQTGGGAGTRTALTVSEGHGYGMLVLALMAGHDPQAQATFDGFLEVLRAFPSSVDPDLMTWAVEAGCTRHPRPASATDGDLDIAYALLLADAQWGSDGAVDYRAAAMRMLAAIDRSEVNPTTRLPRLGDWASGGPSLTAVRSSDLMPGHFRAFAAASGAGADAAKGWSASVDASYKLVATAQQRLSPVSGLLPDFLLGTDGVPTAAQPYFMEGDHDGRFAYNACRIPWRLGTDFVLTGDPRARAALEPMTAWMKSQTGSNPAAVRNGYALDGAPFGTASSLAFTAPLGVAAMTDPAHRPWLDAIFQHLQAAQPTTYYEDTLALLAMIVMTGNWWSP